MLPSVICYVCGSAGANSSLHIYPRDKGSYFPFLETHDPPKGARIPGSDGIVDACQVCYAFLNQQWESYERSKTPAIKRLYWLKRTDNGAFTGAEMRVQGEYVAQMMWLENPPGGKSGQQGYSARSFDLRQSASSLGQCQLPPSPSVAPLMSPVGGGAHNTSSTSPDPADSHQMDSSGALDLSASTASKGRSPAEKPRARREPRDKDDRMNMSKVTCYVCCKEVAHCALRYIYTKPSSEDEPYFPILEKLLMPSGCMPINKSGLTRVCYMCHKTLRQQWRVYESNRVPEDQRTYTICGRPITEVNASGYRSQCKVELGGPGSEAMKLDNSDEVCYLCAQTHHKNSMKLLYTSAPSEISKHSMYFSFVQSMRRPSGARPMDSEHRVLCCRACYSYLQRQWQYYQNENVPVSKRRFTLRPTSETSELTSRSPASCDDLVQSIKTETITSSPAEPLNIVISSSSRERRSTTASTGHTTSGGSTQSGLLAIASPSQFPVSLPAMSIPGISMSSTVPGITLPGVSMTSTMPGISMPGVTLTSTLPVTAAAAAVPSVLSGVPLAGLPPGMSLPGAMTMFPTTLMIPGYQMLPDYSYPINNAELQLAQQGADSGQLNIKKELPDDRQANYKDVQDKNRQEAGSLDQPSTSNSKCVYADRRSTPVNRSVSVDVESVTDRPSPGVAQPGAKSSPLTMVNSVTRTTTTISPLSQSSSGNSITSVNSNAPVCANRQSGFAAALRKLAKQAGDTDTLENSQDVSPGSSGLNATAPSSDQPQELNSLFTKASPPSSGHSGNQIAPTLNSAPLATTTPTPSHRPYLDNRKVPDVSTSSASDNYPHIKEEQNKMAMMPSLSYDRNSRDDNSSHHKDTSSGADSRTTPRATPHSTVGSTSRSLSIDDGHRGFQPYRPGEDATRLQVAAQYPSHYPSALDPVYSAAVAYQNAIMPPHMYPGHPAYRVEDPMLMERYRLLQSSSLFAGYTHPSMMGVSSGVHPYLAALGNRYPPELLAQQQMSYLAAAGLPTSPAKLPDHLSPGVSTERSKSEEEQRRDREKEREREREEHRRVKERESHERLEREHDMATERHRHADSKDHHQHTHRESSNTRHHQHPITSAVENHKKTSSNSKHEELTNSFHNHLMSPSGRDSASYFSAEHLFVPASRHNNISNNQTSQEQPLNLHKTDTQLTLLEKEKERQRMHQEFLREQDRLMHEHDGMHNSRHGMVDKKPITGHGSFQPYSHDSVIASKTSHNVTTASKSSATLSIPKVPLLHHTNSVYHDVKTQPDNTSKFHRPFESKSGSNLMAMTNGLEKEHFSEMERRLLSSSDHRVLAQEHANKVAPPNKWTSSSSSSRNAVYPNSKSFSSSATSSASKRSCEHDDHVTTSSAGERSRHQARIADLVSADGRQKDAIGDCHLNSLATISSMAGHKHLIKAEPANHVTVVKPEERPVRRELVSKLDLEEKLLREALANGACNGTDSDSDNEIEVDIEDLEERHQRLMLISSGPPLKLDTSKAKLDFLGQFGLTTHSIRQEEEFNQRRKRRRIYHERSVSPVEIIDGQRTSSPLVLPPTTSSEELNTAPDYRKKVSFLFQLGLEPVPVERRHELEMIRRVCEWDRSRRMRHKDTSTMTSLENHFLWYERRLQPRPSAAAYSSPLKRKHADGDTNSSEICHKRAPTLEDNDVVTPSGDSSTACVKNYLNLSDTPLSSSTPHPVIKAPTRQTLWKPNGRSAFSSLGHSPIERDARRAISREFAQEFHESVLQTTRQQQESKSGHSTKSSVEVHYTLDQLGGDQQAAHTQHNKRHSPVPSTQPLGPSTGVSVLPPTSVSHTPPTLVAPSGELSRQHVGDNFQWPGVDVLIEAYHRHLEEQHLEQHILQEQCQRLQQSSRELNDTAETLSLRMAELLQNKHRLEEERYSTQTAIDNLKKSLKLLCQY